MQYLLNEDEYQVWKGCEVIVEPSGLNPEQDEMLKFIYKMFSVCKISSYTKAEEFNAQYIAIEIPLEKLPPLLVDMLAERQVLRT